MIDWKAAGVASLVSAVLSIYLSSYGDSPPFGAILIVIGIISFCIYFFRGKSLTHEKAGRDVGHAAERLERGAKKGRGRMKKMWDSLKDIETKEREDYRELKIQGHEDTEFWQALQRFKRNRDRNDYTKMQGILNDQRLKGNKRLNLEEGDLLKMIIKDINEEKQIEKVQNRNTARMIDTLSEDRKQIDPELRHEIHHSLHDLKRLYDREHIDKNYIEELKNFENKIITEGKKFIDFVEKQQDLLEDIEGYGIDKKINEIEHLEKKKFTLLKDEAKAINGMVLTIIKIDQDFRKEQDLEKGVINELDKAEKDADKYDYDMVA